MTVHSSMTKIKEILTTNNIFYCLIGGYAVSIWGAVRSTLDVDLLILVDRDEQAALVDYLSDKGYKVQLRKADMFDPIGDVINIVIENIPVQLICRKYQWETEMIKRAVELRMGDSLEFPVATAEDLIIMKLRAGSFLDLQDAKNILQIRREELDFKYLNELVKKLKLKKIASQVEPDLV